MKYSYLTALLMILLFCGTCRKVEDYFRSPDTSVMAETLITCMMTGYAANVALVSISGNEPAYVNTIRSNPGFPCTSLMTLNMNQPGPFPFPSGAVSSITIAGLWADENTGILTLLFTSYNAGTTVLSLLGIETIPVIQHDGSIMIALADMDIKFDPDQQSILEIDLDEMEISTEFDRLYEARPLDVYVAVEQRAFFIDIDENGTFTDITDDSYMVTGGGQLVEATETSAGIIQQAMIEVLVSPDCIRNPLSGLALMQATGAEASGFPELGSVLFQFHDACDGMADVLLATGMYLPSNGGSVSFNLR